MERPVEVTLGWDSGSVLVVADQSDQPRGAPNLLDQGRTPFGVPSGYCEGPPPAFRFGATEAFCEEWCHPFEQDDQGAFPGPEGVCGLADVVEQGRGQKVGVRLPGLLQRAQHPDPVGPIWGWHPPKEKQLRRRQVLSGHRQLTVAVPRTEGVNELPNAVRGSNQRTRALNTWRVGHPIRRPSRSMPRKGPTNTSTIKIIGP